jgi:hypothetical protein
MQPITNATTMLRFFLAVNGPKKLRAGHVLEISRICFGFFNSGEYIFWKFQLP